MEIKRNYSHTLDGLFWFDLPLGLLLAFVFHNIIRNSLFDNLPSFLKSRFLVFRQFNWNQHFKRNWFVVMVSVLIGAASHIFWDSFTHDHGYFVNTFSGLKNSLDFLGGQIPILKILQHSSTFLGGFIIALTIFKLPTNKVDSGNVNMKYWITAVGFILIIVSIRVFCGLDFKQYGNVIVNVISAALMSLTIVPIALKKVK